MNILLIHNYYRQRGGEDGVFDNESKALIDRGHTVIKYTRHNDETESLGLIDRIKFFNSTVYSKRTVKDILEIISSNKIEIAHIHNVFPLISPSVYDVLKKNNIKVIQTIHNYRFLCPSGVFYRDSINCQLCQKGNFIHCVIHKCYRGSLLLSKLYAYTIKKNQKYFRNNIDAYITLTDFTKNIFIESGFDKNKIFVKDNGITDTNKRRKMSKGYFLYLGRLSEEKGIDFLLESFKEYKEYRLMLAGTGPKIEALRFKYESSNIEFLGVVKGESKDLLIREAEAVIIPSVCFENYPLAIAEASSFGIPAIGSKIGGIPYIIKEDHNGLLFETNNSDSFKRSLDRFINDKLRNKLGDNARKIFEERMVMDKNILILENIYRKVLNG